MWLLRRTLTKRWTKTKLKRFTESQPHKTIKQRNQNSSKIFGKTKRAFKFMESSDRSNFHKITLSLLCEEKKNKSEKSVFQVTANSSTDLPSSV